MKTTAEPGDIQFAALPFTLDPDGRLKVLLMTSRETRRWVIPKGWPIRGLKPREVAAREAFEEAGLLGQIIGKRPRGFYHYSKQMAPSDDVLCGVDVFLLKVDRQAKEWPEKGQREFCWVEPEQAAEMVLEGGLAEVLRSMARDNPLKITKRQRT
jgi:8-oxo-dGTP pyrophosphatase MutT (NUDIX family)